MKRTTTYTALALVLLVVTVSGAFAQARPVDTLQTGEYYYTYPVFGAGLSASLLSGAGLSARVLLDRGLVAQTAFFVLTAGEYTHFNIGAEGEYSLIRSPDSRFYTLLGFGYYSSTSSDSTKPGNRIANPFRIGLGLGYEWFLSRQFVISISGAITYFPRTAEVYPLPQLGMYFYFQ